jgi:hypothetical protein
MLQLTLDYVPAEDRLLLKIGLGDQEARFWLTRRAVKALWHALGQASLQLVARENWSESARIEASEMQRQAAVQRLDFGTKYNTERKPVWDEGSVLASGMEVIANGDGTLMFRLHGANGRYTELPMDANLHAGLSELLRKAVSQSDWDISLDVKSSNMEAPSGGVH